MALNHKIIKARAREWGLTEKEVREVGKRMANYIKKEAKKSGGITDILVLKSFFILNEVKKQKNDSMAKNLALISNKNIIINRYANEIIDKHMLHGWGSRKIVKWLKEAHRADISHSTIYKFLKEYKEHLGDI